MDPVVQWVRTIWTKKSRGGANFARRNATPVAFALPTGAAPLVHEVVMREEDDFQPHAVVQPACQPSGLVLTEADDGLEIELLVPPACLPQRTFRPSRVTLRPGEWVRWQVNYRFTATCGTRLYQLDTLNLCYGDASTDVFLGSPVRFVDERRHLR